MIVIADTAPINYLVLIGEQNILPTLFDQILIPKMVLRELLATLLTWQQASRGATPF